MNAIRYNPYPVSAQIYRIMHAYDGQFRLFDVQVKMALSEWRKRDFYLKIRIHKSDINVSHKTPIVLSEMLRFFHEYSSLSSG